MTSDAEESEPPDVPTQEPFESYNLPNQYFLGPKSERHEGRRRDKVQDAYASISILEPVVTVERHNDEYHIAARFNIETTILGYDYKSKSGHERFFQDICLQYWAAAEERLVMKPQSSPATAFTVTRNTATTTSAGAELNVSQVPSGKVSLGLSRSRELTVEYALDTWTLSAHHVVNDNHDKIGTASTNGSHSERKTPRFQWFWQGTLGETARLSPDLTQAVKRHIVVKRIIAARELSENINVPYNDLKTAQNNSLLGKSGPHNDQVPSPLQRDVRALLDFRFQIQVRVKQRYGRVHRLCRFSTNPLKAQLLKPTYTQRFRIKVATSPPPRTDSGAASPAPLALPLNDTADIDTILDAIKEAYAGKWDQLQSQVVPPVAAVTSRYQTRVQERDRARQQTAELSVPERRVQVEAQTPKRVRGKSQWVDENNEPPRPTNGVDTLPPIDRNFETVVGIDNVRRYVPSTTTTGIDRQDRLDRQDRQDRLDRLDREFVERDRYKFVSSRRE